MNRAGRIELPLAISFDFFLSMSYKKSSRWLPTLHADASYVPRLGAYLTSLAPVLFAAISYRLADKGKLVPAPTPSPPPLLSICIAD